MKPQRQKLQSRSTRVREVAGEPCYTIADAAKALGRSRPTLMRWCPHFRRYTGHAALKDGNSRWYFPVAAVERLQHDAKLLKELAKCANEPDGQLSRCVRDVSSLKKEVSRLRADVNSLRRQLKKTA